MNKHSLNYHLELLEGDYLTTYSNVKGCHNQQLYKIVKQNEKKVSHFHEKKTIVNKYI